MRKSTIVVSLVMVIGIFVTSLFAQGTLSLQDIKNYVDGRFDTFSSEVNPTISTMTDGQAVGIFATATLAVSCNVGEVLYLGTSGYDKANASSSLTLICSAIAISTGSGVQKIMRHGFIKNSAWSFTKGQLVYVSSTTAGALTTTQPVSGFIQAIGIAEDTNVLYFNPSMTAFQVN